LKTGAELDFGTVSAPKAAFGAENHFPILANLVIFSRFGAGFGKNPPRVFSRNQQKTALFSDAATDFYLRTERRSIELACRLRYMHLSRLQCLFDRKTENEYCGTRNAARDKITQPGPQGEVFRWIVRIVRVPQLQFDPHCNFIPRKIKSERSRESFPEGL